MLNNRDRFFHNIKIWIPILIFIVILFYLFFLPIKTNKKEINFILKNKIILPTNKIIDPDCFGIIYNKDKELICFKTIDSFFDSIFIYNFNENQTERVSLKYFNYNYPDDNVIGFYPLNGDSIYVTCLFSKFIYLINKNGLLIKKIKPVFNKNYTFTDNDFQLFAGIFLKFGDKFIVNQFYNYSKFINSNNITNSYKKLISASPNFLIQIKDSTYTFTEIGEYPNEYKKLKDNLFYYYYWHSKTTNEKQQIVYMWKSINKLFIFNNKNVLVDIKEIHNKNYKKVKLFPEKSYYDYSYINDYTISNGLFENIIYDKYRKVYYLIYRPKYTKDYLRENKIQYPCFAPFNIIIIDESFNIINEIDFPPNKYVFDILGVSKKGLLIGNSTLRIKDSTERSLTLFEVLVTEK